MIHLLVGLEALSIAGLAYGMLASIARVPFHDIRFAVAAALAIAAAALACVVVSGGNQYDRFASRKALLPGALLAAVLAAIAARAGGANWAYAGLCAITLFAGVYIVKVPTMLLLRWLKSAGRLTRLVAVAANKREARRAVVATLEQRDDIEIVFSGTPFAQDTLRLLSRNGSLDEIVIADSETGDLTLLADLPVLLVRMLPQDRTLSRRIGHQGQREMPSPWNGPAAIIAQPPLRDWGAVCKRTLDIAGALAGLLLLSPVLIATAIAVKLESAGPVLFVQERAGYRNRPFRMFKFRSMQAARADSTGAQLTLRHDPRVTRVGAFLRRTSIDELPQLFNVLIGDMSLVGPRPHPRGAKAGKILYDELIPNFFSRYRMKPGITGLAQVSGQRGNTETEQHLIDRFRSDLRYAATWSPALDIVILFRTVSHVLKGTNAF